MYFSTVCTRVALGTAPITASIFWPAAAATNGWGEGRAGVRQGERLQQ